MNKIWKHTWCTLIFWQDTILTFSSTFPLSKLLFSHCYTTESKLVGYKNQITKQSCYHRTNYMCLVCCSGEPNVIFWHEWFFVVLHLRSSSIPWYLMLEQDAWPILSKHTMRLTFFFVESHFALVEMAKINLIFFDDWLSAAQHMEAYIHLS